METRAFGRIIEDEDEGEFDDESCAPSGRVAGVGRFRG
jgi:hypothetical protein